MKLKNLFLLLLLTACWGPSFLFIKVAVVEIPPTMLTTLRLTIGALVLNIYLAFKGESFPWQRSFLQRATLAGIFAQGLPFFLMNWGEQYVDSSVASLLNGLTPMATLVFGHVLLSDERFTAYKANGIALGLVGLLFLLWPNVLSGNKATIHGIIAITVAAISYGLGMVYSRKYLLRYKPVHAPAAQLSIMALLSLPFALYGSSGFVLSEISGEALFSLLMLGTIGTAIGFVIYFRILKEASASFLSTVTYLMPVFGVLLGVLLLDERLSLWMVFGALIILRGIYLVNRKDRDLKHPFHRLDRALFSRFR